MELMKSYWKLEEVFLGLKAPKFFLPLCIWVQDGRSVWNGKESGARVPSLRINTCWTSAAVVFMRAFGGCYWCVPASALLTKISLVAWWPLPLPAPHLNSQHHRFFIIFFFLILIFTCLIIWLHRVSVASHGIQFPDQGSNRGPLHRELEALATGPAGKSHCSFLNGFTFSNKCDRIRDIITSFLVSRMNSIF